MHTQYELGFGKVPAVRARNKCAAAFGAVVSAVCSPPSAARILADSFVSNAVVAGLAHLLCLVARVQEATPTTTLALRFSFVRARVIFCAGVVWTTCPRRRRNRLADGCTRLWGGKLSDRVPDAPIVKALVVSHPRGAVLLARRLEGDDAIMVVRARVSVTSTTRKDSETGGRYWQRACVSQGAGGLSRSLLRSKGSTFEEAD